MAAAKGNQNAKGHKGGGGRKSAYQERADAGTLFKAFFGHVDIEAIESRIRQNKASIWDRVLLTAMEGDSRILSKLIEKAFPDKHEVTGKDGSPLVIVRAPDGGTSPRAS